MLLFILRIFLLLLAVKDGPRKVVVSCYNPNRVRPGCRGGCPNSNGASSSGSSSSNPYASPDFPAPDLELHAPITRPLNIQNVPRPPPDITHAGIRDITEIGARWREFRVGTEHGHAGNVVSSGSQVVDLGEVMRRLTRITRFSGNNGRSISFTINFVGLGTIGTLEYYFSRTTPTVGSLHLHINVRLLAENWLATFHRRLRMFSALGAIYMIPPGISIQEHPEEIERIRPHSIDGDRQFFQGAFLAHNYEQNRVALSWASYRVDDLITRNAQANTWTFRLILAWTFAYVDDAQGTIGNGN